jgi:hypothetical protein
MHSAVDCKKRFKTLETKFMKKADMGMKSLKII